MKFIILKATIYFLYSEIKYIVNFIRYLIYFLKKNSLFKYLIYREKSFLITKDIQKKEALKKNYDLWNLASKEKKYKDYFLITGLVSVDYYTLYNCLIGLNLARIIKKNPIALVKKNDFETEAFMRSFGIKNFYYIDNGNIFRRIKFFIKAINFIGSHKKTDSFLELKYENVYVGKIVYDHYVRHTGIASVENIHYKFYYFLSQTLLVHNFSKKFFNEISIKEVVQTESQFIPSCIIFQNSLLNNCKVYSKIGMNNKISVRVFNNFKEVYINRHRYTKKLFNEVFQNHREVAINEGNKIIKGRFQGEIEYQADHNIEEKIDFLSKRIINKDKKMHFTKKEICQKLNWDVDTPIAMIFSADLTDGIFSNSWTIFKDNLTWLKSTLNAIKDFKNINWIIKPHPNDLKNKVITNTENEVNKLVKKYRNIALLPNNFANFSLPDIISAAVSAQGSAGYEYPSFGIPTIICGESLSSGHGFSNEPKTEEEYYNLLKNINKLEALKKEQIDKAKTFVYIYTKLSKVHSPLVPDLKKLEKGNKEFWKNLDKLLLNYDPQKDDFRKNFEIQLKKNDTHTINYNLLS